MNAILFEHFIPLTIRCTRKRSQPSLWYEKALPFPVDAFRRAGVHGLLDALFVSRSAGQDFRLGLIGHVESLRADLHARLATDTFILIHIGFGHGVVSTMNLVPPDMGGRH
jgi:hypothetical protein